MTREDRDADGRRAGFEKTAKHHAEIARSHLLNAALKAPRNADWEGPHEQAAHGVEELVERLDRFEEDGG